MTRFPGSIAIAGAWGYIGRKVLDAALRAGVRTSVYDPGPWPADLDPGAFTRIASAADFYRQDAALFHLALHPAARRPALATLLGRAAHEPIWILNEKPMVAPDRPAEGPRLIEAVERSQAVMLFDFPELFDPLTRRIVEHLARFQRVELSAITLQRSKDREDPAMARNYKPMVPIQYQETVHCLAYVLFLLATLRGSVEAALADGITAEAEAAPYCPPNPERYPVPVDGRCAYRLRWGGLAVEGLTDFKRGAPWRKRRLMRGVADGQPFAIEAEYLEGAKYLLIDGHDLGMDAAANSYEAILATIAQWQQTVPAATLRQGAYPNPRLAWLAYQLSAVLWQSSHAAKPIAISNLEALNGFSPGRTTA
jgi:predicted dehydrogenase